MIRTILYVLIVIFSSSVCASDNEDDYPWLDEMHRSIGDSVNVSAQWFDELFAYENQDENEDQKAKGEARIRLAWEPRSGDFSDFGARVRVRVKLPKLKNRADIILSDYDDDSPQDKVRAGRSDDINRQDRFSLALRFKPKKDSGISHRLGIGRRFQIFARSRYRHQFDFTDNTDLRWEASVYYYTRDKLGADTRFTFDHKSTEHSVYRFSNRFFYRDRTEDWLWQHSIQNFRQLEDNAAVIFGYYIEGVSRPNYRLEEYLASIRWRKQALRQWLFYEIEPFILWRRDEDFSASYGIALRIEGNFGNL